MKREIRIVINCDEGFVADTLREFAGKYEDEFGDWYECEHGSGFLEFVNVPDPEPSLEDVFTAKRESVLSERDRKQKERLDMQDEEREWINETLPKLKFLEQHGFSVTKYFGGFVEGWPYNYIRIDKSDAMNCWVEIEGSTARRKDGTIDHVSPIIYNTEVLTLDGLIKKIAEW